MAANATTPQAGLDAGASALRIGTGVAMVALLILLVWLATRRRVVGTSTTTSFLAHLEELRRRILASVAAILAGTLFAFSFRWDAEIGAVGAPRPAVADNLAAQMFGVIRDAFVPDGVTLVVVRPLDAFVAEMFLAFGLGVALALPVVVLQAVRFLGPALRSNERRLLLRLLVPVVSLFAAGVAFAYLWVLPFLFRTLYAYATPLGAEPLLQVRDLVGFSVTMMLVFGISFQLPLVMFGLTRTGLVESATFVRHWRHALVAIFIFSAFVTDPTIVSQIMVAGPMMLLYMLGVVAALVAQRRAGITGPSR